MAFENDCLWSPTHLFGLEFAHGVSCGGGFPITGLVCRFPGPVERYRCCSTPMAHTGLPLSVHFSFLFGLLNYLPSRLPAIPQQVALQQSLPPFRRYSLFSSYLPERHMPSKTQITVSSSGTRAANRMLRPMPVSATSLQPFFWRPLLQPYILIFAYSDFPPTS